MDTLWETLWKTKALAKTLPQLMMIYIVLRSGAIVPNSQNIEPLGHTQAESFFLLLSSSVFYYIIIQGSQSESVI